MIAENRLTGYIGCMFSAPVKRLFDLFEQEGHQIRIVGGWVRDKLRGVYPNDFDLCTTALPEQMLMLCEKHDLGYADVGIKHGTLGIAVDHQVFEVTTLRVDRETDGRHAIVEFTTDWEADAARRDFTINAMSMDAQGNIHDYFNGRQHVRENCVVFVGNPADRMREDYLRILRYYRLKGRMDDLRDDRETEQHICACASGLQQIAAERIWMEMAKILAGNNLSNILWGMHVTQVLDNIRLMSVAPGDINRAVMVRKATENPVTILAALTMEPLADAWRLSRPDASLLRWLQAARNGRPPYFAELKDIATTKGLGKEYAVEWCALFGPHPNLDEIRAWEVPELPVRGADLIELGIEPGVEMGYALRRLEMIWKTTNYGLSKEELLKFLRRRRED